MAASMEYQLRSTKVQAFQITADNMRFHDKWPQWLLDLTMRDKNEVGALWVCGEPVLGAVALSTPSPMLCITVQPRHPMHTDMRVTVIEPDDYVIRYDSGIIDVLSEKSFNQLYMPIDNMAPVVAEKPAMPILAVGQVWAAHRLPVYRRIVSITDHIVFFLVHRSRYDGWHKDIVPEDVNEYRGEMGSSQPFQIPLEDFRDYARNRAALVRTIDQDGLMLEPLKEGDIWQVGDVQHWITFIVNASVMEVHRRISTEPSKVDKGQIGGASIMARVSTLSVRKALHGGKLIFRDGQAVE